MERIFNRIYRAGVAIMACGITLLLIYGDTEKQGQNGIGFATLGGAAIYITAIFNRIYDWWPRRKRAMTTPPNFEPPSPDDGSIYVETFPPDSDLKLPITKLRRG